MTQPELLELLFAAVKSDFGVVIETNNPRVLRQRLYPLRTEDLDTFGDLAFHLSPTDPQTQLWIVKKSMLATNPETVDA